MNQQDSRREEDEKPLRRVPIEWRELMRLLLDPAVSEIATNGPDAFFYKKKGKRYQYEPPTPLSDEDYIQGIEDGLVPHVKELISFGRNSYLFEGPLNFRARLNNGEPITIRGRCHIVLPPAADHAQVTIAKKSTSLATVDAIAAGGSMSYEMLLFMKAAMKAKLTVILSGGTGSGKSLTHDTVIPTPSGSKTMGTIQVGDEIFDHHGKTGKVLKKFPQPSRQVYCVTFDTGEKFYCDREHNWYVSDSNEKEAGSYNVRTTAEMIESVVATNDGVNRFGVPNLEKPVAYNRSQTQRIGLGIDELPMDAFVLGASFAAGNETFDKKELLIDYELASIEVRKQLVAGIKSTIVGQDHALAEEVVELLHRVENSLGRDGEERRIIKIEEVAGRFEEMSCITVDTEDSTYLIGESFIPTHNTTMLEACSKLISNETRIGVAEDTPELSLSQPNVTYLHSVPWQPGLDPNSVATLSWVVQQFQRMRTDRVVIGETRGKEFADFLIAANSGMEGSITTMHADNPKRCLDKMTNFAMKGSTQQPIRSINKDISSAVDLVIQLIYTDDGQYRMSQIEYITETISNNEEASITTETLYEYIPSQDGFKRHNSFPDKLKVKLRAKGVDLTPFEDQSTFGKIHPGHRAPDTSSTNVKSHDMRPPQQHGGLPSPPPGLFGKRGR